MFTGDGRGGVVPKTIFVNLTAEYGDLISLNFSGGGGAVTPPSLS